MIHDLEILYRLQNSCTRFVTDVEDANKELIQNDLTDLAAALQDVLHDELLPVIRQCEQENRRIPEFYTQQLLKEYHDSVL